MDAGMDYLIIGLIVIVTIELTMGNEGLLTIGKEAPSNATITPFSPLRAHVTSLHSILETAHTIIFINHAEDWSFVEDLSEKKALLVYDQQIMKDFCDWSPNMTSISDSDEEFFQADDVDLPIFSKRNYKTLFVAYIIETTLKELELIQNCLIYPRQTYIFTIPSQNKTQEYEQITVAKISNVLTTAWSKLGTINVFILWNNTMFTYNPLKRTDSGSFGMIAKNSTSLFDWTALTTVDGFPMFVDLFYSAYITAFYADKNETILLGFQGADYEVMKVIQERMNFTLMLQKSDRDLFGFKLDNGSFNGALGRIIAHKSDMALTGYFIKDYLTREIEFTGAVYGDSLCVVVKKASKIPESVLPLACFHPYLWTCLCMFTVFIGMVWAGLRIVNQTKIFTTVYMTHALSEARSRNKYQELDAELLLQRENRFNLSIDVKTGPPYYQYVQIMIDSVILMLSAPLLRFPRVNSERLFLATVCLLSLTFTSIFQSNLATVFIKPLYYKDINTLEQLEESGQEIRVKYKGFLDDVFPENSTTIIQSLRRRMKLVTLRAQLMKQISDIDQSQAFGTITRKSSTALDNAYYFSSSQLNMVKECPRTYNIAYVLPKDSVFADRINDILQRLLNAGLIDRWIDAMRYNNTLDNLKKFGPNVEANFKVLTVVDLQLGFFILCVGCFLSFCVFLLEKFRF